MTARRPRTIAGLLLRLARLRRKEARLLGAAGAGALVGASLLAAAPPREAGGREPASRAPWIAQFLGVEIVADDRYVYWAEARYREYDDRDVSISRAAVRRRAHEGGQVETLFDYERDDTYCLPGALRLFDGALAWHCRRPVFDGYGRADPSRYAVLRDGRRREVPAPWALPDRVAARGDEVVFLVTRSTPHLAHLDLPSGVVRRGVDVPRPLASGGQLVGVTERSVFGVGREGRDELLWSAPRRGRGALKRVFEPPEGGPIHGAAVDDRAALVSYEDYLGRAILAQLDGRRARELRRTTAPMRALTPVGDHVYLHERDGIVRVRLGSPGGSERVAEGARLGYGSRPIAVGGGYVYWREDRALMRALLP